MSCESGQGVTNLDEHIVEWICMELPADPAQLQYGAFHPDSFRTRRPKEDYLWQLSDGTKHSEPEPFIMDIY